MKTTKVKLSLVMTMVIWGSIGIFRRDIPLSSGCLAMFRGVLGMFTMLLLLKLQGKQLNLQMIKKHLGMLLLSGGFIGVNWILLFESYLHTSIATATLSYYMAPIFVLMLSPFVLKQSLNIRKSISILIALAGMVCISGVFQNTGEAVELTGILLGLGAAVFYAAVMLMGPALKEIKAEDKTVVQLGAAALVVLPYVIIRGNTGLGEMHAHGLIMLLIVGVVHTGLAYLFYFDALGKLQPQVVALFGYIDPITAILLSTILQGEPMSLWEIVGTICILAGTFLSEMPEKRQKS